MNIEPGGRGQFDVEADGKLLFSKHKEDRFPENGEIVSALKGLTASPPGVPTAPPAPSKSR